MFDLSLPAGHFLVNNLNQPVAIMVKQPDSDTGCLSDFTEIQSAIREPHLIFNYPERLGVRTFERSARIIKRRCAKITQQAPQRNP